MAKNNVVISLDGFQARSGSSFWIRRQRSVELGLPDQFTPESMKKMHRDLEILTKMSSEHSEEWMQMNNAALAFDFHRANEIAKKIGLDEHRISSEGGGLNWVVAVIAIASAVLLASDSGPRSGEGGSDAGRDSGNDGPPEAHHEE